MKRIDYKKLTFYEMAGAFGNSPSLVTKLNTTKLPMFIYHNLRYMGFFLDKIAKLPRKVIAFYEVEHVIVDENFKNKQKYWKGIINKWEKWHFKKKR